MNHRTQPANRPLYQVCPHCELRCHIHAQVCARCDQEFVVEEPVLASAPAPATASFLSSAWIATQALFTMAPARRRSDP